MVRARPPGGSGSGGDTGGRDTIDDTDEQIRELQREDRDRDTRDSDVVAPDTNQDTGSRRASGRTTPQDAGSGDGIADGDVQVGAAQSTPRNPGPRGGVSDRAQAQAQSLQGDATAGAGSRRPRERRARRKQDDANLIERSRRDVSSVGRMSLSDPAALRARREKEQEQFELLERTAEADVNSAEDVARTAVYLPSAAAGATGQVVGRGLTEAGRGIEERTTPDVGPSVGGEQLANVPGHLVGGGLAFVGAGVSAVGQAPYSVSRDVEQLARGEEIPTAKEGGGVETVETFGKTQASAARERPVSTAVGFALPFAEAVPAGVRGVRATRGTRGRTVKFREITSERGQSGEFPRFETGEGASTRQAVGEVQRRAADQPEAVQEATAGESVLYHTTTEGLGRGTTTVGEGSSELPGVFTSPDASPIGVSRVRAESSTSPRFGRGDFSLSPDQVAGFEVSRGRIRGMPERAAGQGYAVRRAGEVRETGLSRGEASAIAERTGGERVPDPTTSGYRYLTEEAEPGTAQVKPSGARSSELEAVIPPESRFAAGERIAVELPSGERVPLDFYRPTEQPTRAGGTSGARGGRTGADVAASRTSLAEVRGQPRYTPTSTAGGFGAGSAVSGRTRPSSEPTPSTPPLSPPPATSGSTAPTDGGSSLPSSPPSEPPTVPPTSPPSSPPTRIDSAPPSDPPTAPPTSPPTGSSSTGQRRGGAPPAEPPSEPPAILQPTTPATKQVRRTSDRGDDDRDLFPFFGGGKDPSFVDFLDPTTGEVLPTARDTAGPELDEPAFLGFVEPDQ